MITKLNENELGIVSGGTVVTGAGVVASFVIPIGIAYAIGGKNAAIEVAKTEVKIALAVLCIIEGMKKDSLLEGVLYVGNCYRNNERLIEEIFKKFE